ncbi:MAG: extracellular solute-binding protein [Candidatus Izemoplasma sp.]
MKTINILAVGDPAVDVYVDQEQHIIKNYEQKNNIKINFDIVPWVDYYDTLINSFKSYTYDIVMVAGHLWLNDFVANDYLLEIKVDKSENYSYFDFLPNIRKELTKSNKQYLLPSFCDGHILMYRQSQIKETINDTIDIDEILSIVKNNVTADKSTFVLKSHPSEIFLDFLPYLRNNGNSFIDPSGLPLFNNKEVINSLKTYLSLKEYSSNGIENFGNEEVKNEIQLNKCKLGISWSGQLGQIMNNDCIDPDDIKFMNIKNSWNVTWSFALNKHTTNIDEATDFIHYLTSKKIDKLVGAHCGNPTRGSSFVNGFNKYPWYKAVYDMINTSTPLNTPSSLGRSMGIMTSYLTKAINNELSTSEAIALASEDILNKL